MTAMQTAQPQGIRGLIFSVEGDLLYGQVFLTVTLPSGRKLYYPKPFLNENQFGKMALHYYAVGQQTKKWGVESTYGGKMTENRQRLPGCYIIKDRPQGAAGSVPCA